jgi:GNAT superfamily N-acetyltransferase
MCPILEWDTRFFGFCIARAAPEHLTAATAEQVVAECEASGIRCLYFLAGAEDRTTVALLEKYQFGLKDIRLTMICRNPQVVLPAQGPPVRVVDAGDIPTLRLIARTSHKGTRFYADSNFPVRRCDDLYDVWITQCCEPGSADTVLVAERAGRPAGYITCSMISPIRGQIGLFAVASEARGTGIGTALIQHAIRWFQARGAADIVTITQGGNVGAVRVYECSGFIAETVQLWYHRWFEPRPDYSA